MAMDLRPLLFDVFAESLGAKFRKLEQNEETDRMPTSHCARWLVG